MRDAVDDCCVVLQQGTTSTLSRNSRGETKRGKMDQPQTRFEESAVIGSVRHQDPLGYAKIIARSKTDKSGSCFGTGQLLFIVVSGESPLKKRFC